MKGLVEQSLTHVSGYIYIYVQFGRTVSEEERSARLDMHIQVQVVQIRVSKNII